MVFDTIEIVYKYIAKESILEADKAFDQIEASTEELSDQSERYPPDKYKKNNNGNYRAYEIYRYRIAKKNIYIIRLRSTDQNPREY